MGGSNCGDDEEMKPTLDAKVKILRDNFLGLSKDTWKYIDILNKIERHICKRPIGIINHLPNGWIGICHIQASRTIAYCHVIAFHKKSSTIYYNFNNAGSYGGFRSHSHFYLENRDGFDYARRYNGWRFVNQIDKNFSGYQREWFNSFLPDEPLIWSLISNSVGCRYYYDIPMRGFTQNPSAEMVQEFVRMWEKSHTDAWKYSNYYLKSVEEAKERRLVEAKRKMEEKEAWERDREAKDEMCRRYYTYGSTRVGPNKSSAKFFKMANAASLLAKNTKQKHHEATSAQ